VPNLEEALDELLRVEFQIRTLQQRRNQLRALVLRSRPTRGSKRESKMAAAEPPLTAHQRRILEELQNRGPLKPPMLIQITKWQRFQVYACLYALLKKGLVKKSHKGEYSTP